LHPNSPNLRGQTFHARRKWQSHDIFTTLYHDLLNPRLAALLLCRQGGTAQNQVLFTSHFYPLCEAGKLENLPASLAGAFTSANFKPCA
jgi:hypothetical protein